MDFAYLLICAAVYGLSVILLIINMFRQNRAVRYYGKEETSKRKIRKPFKPGTRTMLLIVSSLLLIVLSFMAALYSSGPDGFSIKSALICFLAFFLRWHWIPLLGSYLSQHSYKKVFTQGDETYVPVYDEGRAKRIKKRMIYILVPYLIIVMALAVLMNLHPEYIPYIIPAFAVLILVGGIVLTIALRKP